jgi:SAM-dependent methyltransferase
VTAGSEGASSETQRATLGAGYFDGQYAATPDPWGFTSRWYERRKYAISVALLPAERYRSGFEPGCSIGVLTSMLAARCGTLLACDMASSAVAAAARRTAPFPQVRVEQRALPGGWPGGRFDLVVFSEMLYYLGDEDLRRTELTLLADHREPDFLAQVYLAVPAGTDPASVSVAAAEGLT